MKRGLREWIKVYFLGDIQFVPVYFIIRHRGFKYAQIQGPPSRFSAPKAMCIMGCASESSVELVKTRDARSIPELLESISWLKWGGRGRIWAYVFPHWTLGDSNELPGLRTTGTAVALMCHLLFLDSRASCLRAYRYGRNPTHSLPTLMILPGIGKACPVMAWAPHSWWFGVMPLKGIGVGSHNGPISCFSLQGFTSLPI